MVRILSITNTEIIDADENVELCGKCAYDKQYYDEKRNKINECALFYVDLKDGKRCQTCIEAEVPRSKNGNSTTNEDK
jgi:hypothetical protein